MRPLRPAVVACLLLPCVACTERRLFVRTEPPNARVRVNGEPVGRSPVGWEFHHYGTVRVTAERDGYHPASADVRLRPPWWQRPGADFVTDVLWPGTLRDLHEVVLRLEPLPPRDDEAVAREFEELAAAAEAMRAETDALADEPPAER